MRTSTWFCTVFYFKEEVHHLPAGSRAKSGILLSDSAQIKRLASRPGAGRLSQEKRAPQESPFPTRRHLLTTQIAAGVSVPRPRSTARLLCARKPGTLSQPTTWKPLTLEEENQRTSEAPSSNRRGSRWDPPPGPQPWPHAGPGKRDAERRACREMRLDARVGCAPRSRRDYISHRYLPQR